MILRIGEHYINTAQVTHWQTDGGRPGPKQVWVYFDNNAASNWALCFTGVQAAAVTWWLERNGGEDLLELHQRYLENVSSK